MSQLFKNIKQYFNGCSLGRNHQSKLNSQHDDQKISKILSNLKQNQFHQQSIYHSELDKDEGKQQRIESRNSIQPTNDNSLINLQAFSFRDGGFEEEFLENQTIQDNNHYILNSEQQIYRDRLSYQQQPYYKSSLSITTGSSKKSHQTWTLGEDQLLKQAVLKYGEKNWKEIAKLIPGRTHNQCQLRWKRIKPLKNRQPWTKDEDHHLLDLVQKYGYQWNLIAGQLGNRNSKQAKERYLNQLDPQINRAKFTADEDQLIIQSYQHYGPQWNEISRFFQNRPQNKIKNRFYSHLKKKLSLNEEGALYFNPCFSSIHPSSSEGQSIISKSSFSAENFYQENQYSYFTPNNQTNLDPSQQLENQRQQIQHFQNEQKIQDAIQQKKMELHQMTSMLQELTQKTQQRIQQQQLKLSNPTDQQQVSPHIDQCMIEQIPPLIQNPDIFIKTDESPIKETNNHQFMHFDVDSLYNSSQVDIELFQNIHLEGSRESDYRPLDIQNNTQFNIEIEGGNKNNPYPQHNIPQQFIQSMLSQQSQIRAINQLIMKSSNQYSHLQQQQNLDGGDFNRNETLSIKDQIILYKQTLEKTISDIQEQKRLLQNFGQSKTLM